MTIRIPRSKVFYAFSPHLTPVAHARQNEPIIFETNDCFEGQVRKPEDMLGELDWSHINPATGPVYIEDVTPGDILKVEITNIVVDDQAVVVCMPESGAIGDLIRQAEAVIMPIHAGEAIYKNRVKIPIDPMIGVIGVAPSAEDIATGVPDYHGGNMDCTAIRKGVSLYLTAGVEGALLGCGDLHAMMGDGEIIVTGAETNGEVHLKVSVMEMKGLPTPLLEDERMIATLYSAPTIDEASDGAIHRMARFLSEFVGLSINDTGMLMSLVGELKFCQVVDPKRTVRFEFPKQVLADYGYVFGR